jgi:hypothetical protein
MDTCPAARQQRRYAFPRSSAENMRILCIRTVSSQMLTSRHDPITPIWGFLKQCAQQKRRTGLEPLFWYRKPAPNATTLS